MGFFWPALGLSPGVQNWKKGVQRGTPFLGPGDKNPGFKNKMASKLKNKVASKLKNKMASEETRDGVEIFEKTCWLSLSVRVYFVRVSYMIKKGRCRHVNW